MESMFRYVSPINPAIYPQLSLILLAIGVFFMAWFFVYPLHLHAQINPICIHHNGLPTPPMSIHYSQHLEYYLIPFEIFVI